jgi:surface polysaccharide O-acyltransferase-like enzyme
MAGTDPRAKVRVRDLVDATPDTRNRYVDLIRVASIGAVIIGHWTMAVLAYRDGRFSGGNLLELDPDWQILTWVFMVMPLFFIVGGFTNGGSWISARGRGVRYADWLRGRSARLVRPALWFVAFWATIPVLAVAFHLVPASVGRLGGEEVSLPLWFLAVYLLTVALIPPLVTVHERFGAHTLWGLILGAFVMDNLHFGVGLAVFGGANYVLVWLALFELGLMWRDGRFTDRSARAWAMIAAGLASLVVMVTWFNYPVSMTGLTHATRSNAQPPTLALVALGFWQFGVALLFERRANRWLRKPSPWMVVVGANSMVMTLYLWNMSALVLAAVLLLGTGVAPQPELLGGAWWALRPAWWVACAVCLAPFVLTFRWAERPAGAPPPAQPGRFGDVIVIVGTLVAGAGLGAIAARAFPVPGSEPIVLPTAAIGLVAVGALLLWVDPFAPLRKGRPGNGAPRPPG